MALPRSTGRVQELVNLRHDARRLSENYLDIRPRTRVFRVEVLRPWQQAAQLGVTQHQRA
jgi:hypothetical protein